MKYFLTILIILFSANAFCSEVDVDARCRNLYEIVRCPSCGGQSIKDSNSQISATLREHIKREVLLDKSDKEILDELKAAYGDQIINSTSFDYASLPLWIMPLLIAIILLRLFRVSSLFNSKAS